MWRGRQIECPKCVLITGIPGTHLEAAVNKVTLPAGKTKKVYKVEEHLCRHLQGTHT